MLEIRIGAYRVEVHAAENPRYTAPIVMVHGLWAGAWCWRAFGSFLAHRGWEVLAPDLRGRQGSRPESLEGATFEDYVSDLCQVVSKGGASSPVIVGHDLGGLVAMAASSRILCRAVVALGPPFGEARTAAYDRLLRRSIGWTGRRLARPPREIAAPEVDPSQLQPDSAAVVRDLLRDRLRRPTPSVPALVVAGSRDPFLDVERLEARARELGCDVVVRDADHWSLAGPGFERHADLVHRWLVRKLGAGLLRLTGYEDLDEE